MIDRYASHGGKSIVILVIVLTIFTGCGVPERTVEVVLPTETQITPSQTATVPPVEVPDPTATMTPPPAFPDLGGGMIAFLSDRAADFTELYLLDVPHGVDPGETNERRLAEGFIVGPSWSPDGQRIAYTKMIPNRFGRLDNHGPFEVWVTTLTEGEKLIVSADITDEIKALPWPTPSWSPDGTQIAFIAAHESDERSSVYVVATDGSGLIWSLALPWMSFDVSWSPLGDALLLTSFMDETGFRIFLLSTEDQELTEIYQNAYAADWSPDGAEIVVASYQPPDIQIRNQEGELRNIARLEGRYPLAVTWSLDGEHVVVGSSHSRHLMKITGLHLINLETSVVTSIIEYYNDTYIYSPNWSPSSDHLLFTTTDIGRIHQGDIPYADMWIYDLASEGHYQLTSGTAHDGMGVWSPPIGAETIMDVDGNEYSVLQIGNQRWLGENLNTTRDWEGHPIDSYCYEDDEANCDIYGRLYTWDTAMNGEAQEQAQGICPIGWHIPSDAEWSELFDYLGGEDVAGGAMKAEGTELWDAPNRGATNTSGFNGLPAGAYIPSIDRYEGLGVGVHFWSSTEHGSDAGIPTLHRDYESVVILIESKTVTASVRCLMDSSQ